MTPAERAREIVEQWLGGPVREATDGSALRGTNGHLVSLIAAALAAQDAQTARVTEVETINARQAAYIAELEIAAKAEAAQTRALESLLEIWGERSGNAKDESARLAWFVARNELRIALTGAPREPRA